MSDEEQLGSVGPEDFWGPLPTSEQLAEAYFHGDELRVKSLMDVLSGSLSADHLAHILGVDFTDVHRMIKDRQIIAIEVDEVRKFIPAWQFDEQENGGLVLNKSIDALWKLWGGSQGKDWWDVLGFCEVMIGEVGGSGMKGFEIAKNPNVDKDWQAELRYIIQTHGVNPM